MLYVFLVDTGMMLVLDMNLAVECVSQLKEVISRACRIPEDKQVLLISGGESLDPSSRVCSYSAGTDTNPIFLFSKSTIESSVPPSPSVDHGSESDLREQVDGSLNLPPTYMTVVARAQLAQQFNDVAREETRICERLVHDQHLQQQGWAAVVANLEDITSAFKMRTEVFEQNFHAYLESRDQSIELLGNFSHDRDLLSRIPVLRPLLKGGRRQTDERHLAKVREETASIEEKIASEDEQEDMMEVETTSLLQWISSKDEQSSLESMAEQCVRGLDQFDGETYEGLRAEVLKTLESVDNPSMKEVKGLEDRLYGLEQLMQEARRLVQEQSDLASAFLQNQTRASNLGDASVLPDLCTSHRKQLMVMLQNHRQLQDIRRRCVRAKEELSVNLHARLRWIMYVERTMSEVDSKLVIYHENLKRLKRHLEVIQQIHLAPSVYLAFVVEVVRRRSFSHAFLQWSRLLSSRATEIYKKEVSARKEFLNKVGKHFLYALFPGLDDFPPPFALQTPAEFDGELPDIRLSDVDVLRVSLPEMASSLVVPDVDQQMPGIVVVAVATVKVETEEPSDKDVEPESEPDTEEFEKLEDAAPPGGRRADDEVLERDTLPTSNNSQQPTEETQDKHQEEQELHQPVDLSCAVYTSASHDFFTADFYIDESMPSSYTESNGTCGQLLVSRGIAGHQTIKGHNVIVTELQNRLDEKGTAIIQLQEETLQSRIRIQQLEDKLRRLQALESETIAKLRRDVADAREFVLHSRNNFLCHVVALAAQVSDMTDIVRQRVCTEHDFALRDALTKAKVEHGNVVAEICRQLELESSKLRNACVEVERYQDQLQQGNEMLDNLKDEMASQLEEQRQRLDSERTEIVKSMTLEHELELENLREMQRVDSNETDRQFGQLQEELDKKSEELTNLMTRYADLEGNLSQKFQLEKEEMTKILEETYADRQRRAVEETESSLRREADERMEDLRRTLAAESEEVRRSELQTELEKNRREMAEEHRQEIQALRARCRLAFTTTMERSPSDGSLEKIERPDSADPSRVEQLRQELAESTAALEEQRRLNERLRREKEDSARAMQASFTAQKQIIFNEAIGRATSEKDRMITELRCLLRVAQSELEQEQEMNAKLRMTTSMPIRSVSPPLSEGQHSLPTPLRSPVDETFQMVSPTLLPGLALLSSHSTTFAEQSSSGVCSMISINPTQEGSAAILDASVSPFFLEDSEMSVSTAKIQSDKVAVFTCHVGDLVLFCFDEKHDNYVVFSVGSTCHFLHSDSLDALSLVSSDGEQRRSWTLAEITEKEYCEAKKVPNRYKLPLGRRFYRVKAKPWAAPKREGRSKGKGDKSNKAAA